VGRKTHGPAIRLSLEAFGASRVALLALMCAAPGLAHAQVNTSPPEPQLNNETDIIVTAQKRGESINRVPMSITAVSGDALVSRGITDTAQLVKAIPGFNFTATAYATPVYTIRGIGFQENSLAASPAVSVYVDEIPLPFPVETEGSTLDLERVEVLKGPQGTLYGQNSTGGAINYIAAKPTESLAAGFDAGYARFNLADVQGYVGGPLTGKLSARLSARFVQGGDWQKSYTTGDTLGRINKIQGRLLLDWRPTDRLKIVTNLNFFRDRSDTPAPQAVGIFPQSTLVPIPAGLTNYPLAPSDARAADWDLGRSYRRDNLFYQVSARADYSLSDEVTLTAITAYQHYKRDQPFDTDGTTFNDTFVRAKGTISTFFQELRLSGKAMGRLNWIVGANYEADNTYDENFLQFKISSASNVIGLPLTEVTSHTRQDIRTKAVYGNLDYEIFTNVTLLGGIRYTAADRRFSGCSADSGNGEATAIFNILGPVLRGGAPGPVVATGGCVTLDANFNSGLVRNKLDEDNISWRVGIDWQAGAGALFYANVSKGYKSGSFPTLSASSSVQFVPVTQESVLAYEAGTKLTLFDRRLQLNAAAFYYDYANKQIRGKLPDPIFGTLEGLINIPKSHISGFELSATARPVRGLTISPAVTLVASKIEGAFSNYTPLGDAGNFSGEAFPYTPKWSGNVDVNYEQSVGSRLKMFFGGNLSYQGKTNGGFGELPEFRIRSYALLDLRAGIADIDDRWTVSVFGQNVTNKYYWTQATHLVDVITRYTGMPATYGVRVSYRFQ